MKFLILFMYLFMSYAFASLKTDFIQSKSTYYSSLSLKQFDQSIALFSLLFAQKNPLLQETYLKALGLRMHRYKNTLVIQDTAHRGWGFYIIKHSLSKGAMLSIPHRFHDQGTAQIGYKLFLNFPYKAIAFNTVSRKEHDFAHQRYTVFNAFHLAFIRHFSRQNIYQLHGFSPQKRRGQKAKNAHAIISSQNPALSTCMQGFEAKSLLYGKDVFELGGTKNAQNALLSQEGYVHFSHIELSKIFRQKLQKQKSLRAKLEKCLP